MTGRLVLVGVGIAAVLLVGLTIAAAAGSRRFRHRYEAEKSDLLRRAHAAAALAIGPVAHEDLPAPVRRYLEVTRSFRQPHLRAAVLRQRGALRAAADGRWMPFEAEQAYSMEPPGFVWLARARVAPLVSVLARDAFLDGRGHMLVRVLGLYTVADARGPEMDLGAGLRYWGEMVSFPETVTGPHLHWDAVNERQSRLTIRQSTLTLSAVVDFGDDGLPTGIHSHRYRDVKGTPVLTPWSGHLRGWKEMAGRRFPTDWESVWHLPEGDFSAVTVEVLDLRTE